MPVIDPVQTIQVWRVALDDETLLTPARLAWLDREESARAERFYGHAYAQRWRIAHIALRAILAEATERRPEEVTFIEGEFGKPEMPGMNVPAFNMSHAGDVALIALGVDVDLGVDVEFITDGPDLADIAVTHFAEEERAYIATLPAAERVDAFYRCWTRKEAFVKALGVGIGYDLQSFAVSLDTAPARMLRTPPDLGSPDDWTLTDIALGGSYAGALAVSEPDPHFSVQDWSAP